MKCIFCNGTGKYKQPNDQEKFDNLVDCEMEKGYFVNLEMAEEKAYKAVGYTVIDCPYCQGSQEDK